MSESNGVQLRAIRLLAKFNFRISDERLQNLRQDGILKFHPFAKDRLKPDGGFAQLNSADLAADVARGEILCRV